ncbi:hypothetical protein CsSME_00036107 [Camellia sinensis var. sinensis]
MKGLKATSISHNKIDSEMVKKRKADMNAKKEKASKKNSSALKCPSSAFFVFTFPTKKLADGKKNGLQGKELAKAVIKKAEYKKAMKEFNSRLNGNGVLKPDESGKSSSEVHDEAEQEMSS